MRLLLLVPFVQYGFFLWGWYAWQPYFLDLLETDAVWVAGVISAFLSLATMGGNSLVGFVTRLADRPDAVPDAVWAEAARHYDERGLAGLVLHVATTNVFNRLNVATRQVPGQ